MAEKDKRYDFIMPIVTPDARDMAQRVRDRHPVDSEERIIADTVLQLATDLDLANAILQSQGAGITKDIGRGPVDEMLERFQRRKRNRE